MKKCVKRIGFCFLVATLVWCGTLIADRQRLNEELIRLHVVAASDSARDQSVKLKVRDAVTESLRTAMRDIRDVESAKACLLEKLPAIQATANETLKAAGCDANAAVTLCRESFDTRYYDTFSLPAGVYESLRITIGEGAGKNWWCVVFPSLCVPATTEGFAEVAAGAGFPEALNGALTGEYEVRFFFLDALGRLENLFFLE